MNRDNGAPVTGAEVRCGQLEQFGILACAPTSGEDNTAEEFKQALSFSKKLVVIGDNDPAPETRRKMQAAAKKRAEVLGAELKFPPDQYKDVDEWVLKEPAAIFAINSWLNN